MAIITVGMGGMVNVAGMDVSEMEPFPKNSNPFNFDSYNMGVKLGSNVMAMFESHENEKADYVILVNISTGRRLKITL